MLTSLATLIFPALMPALTDGIRGVFAKFTGGAGGTPQNVNERIQLMQAETGRLEALAKIDQPASEPSRWVTDLRSSFRYIFIAFILLVTGIAVFTQDVPENILLMLLDLSGASMSFVIGERMYLGLKK
jgi:hypothetical protein